MPVPKIDSPTVISTPTTLRGPGVAILVRYGAQLSPPKPDEALPGIRCTQYKGKADTVLMEAIGYSETPAGHEGHTAIARAAQACIDAGLVVSFADTRDSVYPCRIVRRPA